jgi:peptidoglycan/LPS O-acetylase OafA/YrhL
VHLPVERPEVLASLFFFRNYTSLFSHWQTIYPYYTSHFWSLAVEEHFYLILPGLLVLSPRRLRAPLLVTFASAISLHRIAPHSWLSLHTDIRLDALLFPAALAVLLHSPESRQRLMRTVRFAPLFGAILLAEITVQLHLRITGALIAWLTPFLILGTMLNPQSWPSRLLESAPLRYIGRISYSLYSLATALPHRPLRSQYRPPRPAPDLSLELDRDPLLRPAQLLPRRTTPDPPRPPPRPHCCD